MLDKTMSGFLYSVHFAILEQLKVMWQKLPVLREHPVQTHRTIITQVCCKLTIPLH